MITNDEPDSSRILSTTQLLKIAGTLSKLSADILQGKLEQYLSLAGIIEELHKSIDERDTAGLRCIPSEQVSRLYQEE